MIIKDEIGEHVKYSLKAAKLAQSNVFLGGYSSSASSSRNARSLAEDAFFHPSIMSVSYFSYEHCFAVYSPFFLPVAGHIVIAALREWKRYKQEKAKYFNMANLKEDNLGLFSMLHVLCNLSFWLFDYKIMITILH